MTTGDVLVALAILLLCGEVVKSSRISRRTIIDHALSLVLFLGMLIEFILVRPPPRHFSCSSSWASLTCSAAPRLLCARRSETLRLRVSSAFRPEEVKLHLSPT